MSKHGVRGRNPVFLGLLAGSLSLAFLKAHGEVKSADFGTTPEGPVSIYTLTNAHGVEARIMTYGAAIVSVKTPDRSRVFKNIVLGFDSVQPYLAGVPYYGATVGRFANRIAHAQFRLDGSVRELSANDGANSLHGGRRGFDKRLWSAEIIDGRHNKVRLTYVSADGEEGYAGQLTAQVTYELSEDDALKIDYAASTTAPTPINLANHAYFNLTGDPTKVILDHKLMINADTFTPVDESLIPSGERRDVTGSAFDFRVATAIGQRIDTADPQLKLGHGYDHNWVLRGRNDASELRVAAVLSDPASGRTIEIRTTQPGLQFYSGNFMDGKPAGQGSVYNHRTGLCLETQHFPDSPNQPGFPSTILRPGEKYMQTTVLRFGIAKTAS